MLDEQNYGNNKRFWTCKNNLCTFKTNKNAICMRCIKPQIHQITKLVTHDSVNNYLFTIDKSINMVLYPLNAKICEPKDKDKIPTLLCPLLLYSFE